MLNVNFWRAPLALGVILLASPAASGASREQLAALSTIKAGLWEVKELDNPRAKPRAVCIPDPGALVQLQHLGLPCSRVVLANSAQEATVHYTCPAGGYGRTSLRVQTPRLVVVDSQGIVGNRPFAYRADARLKGACTAGSSRR